MNCLPYLTAYDPTGSSEGTLDPLGLYMIADHLATRLVPAVRERMLRIRFLTPITVGALVTEDLEPNDRNPHFPPCCRSGGRARDDANSRTRGQARFALHAP